MSFFSYFFKFAARGARDGAAERDPRKVALTLEALENRLVPASTSTVISGYVYYDGNANGLYDSGEPPLGGIPVALYNSSGTVVNSTVTNGIGYYQFSNDNTINPTPRTVTQTLTVPWQTTDFSVNQALSQFNPNDPTTPGTLTSVTVQFNSAISSDIKVENTSKTSPSVINGEVSGQITLTGPSGLDLVNQPNANAGTFDATIFDGFVDYGGTSGTDFGNQQASATSTVTLTGAALNAFIGNGTVNFNVNTVATSHASGGGNVDASISSSSTSTITVTYTYAPNTNLQTGDYTIVDTPPGHGFIDGWLSSNGTIIPGSFGTHTINVQVTGNNFTSNNNFSELWPGSISGCVWADTGTGSDYNDGIREPEEMGLPNVTLTLTGTTVGGTAVTQTTQTDGNGDYWFVDLTPGTYQVQETPPAGWQDGKDMIGSVGGTNPNHATLAAIQLPNNTNATNYNFGELQPTPPPPPPPPPPTLASLSGYVYGDISASGYNDGIMEADESGIANVLMGLTYIDATTGKLVSLNAVTNATGYYQFANLAAGAYSIWIAQPTGWEAGKVTQGTPGSGTVYPNAILNIALASGVNGTNNNFGELQPNNNTGGATASLTGYVYGDTNNDGIFEAGEPPIANATVTLTGVTNQNQSVSMTTQTNSSGFYSFTVLQAGTYQIQETTPTGWIDGKDTQGTPGNGTVGRDVFSNIQLAAGVAGTNNNFGNLQPVVSAAFSGTPVAITPQFVPTPLDSKNNLFTTSGAPSQDATLQAEATYIDGLYRTLLGRPSDYAGLSYWINQLQAGASLQQVVTAFWYTPTHLSIEVNTFYQTYLGRAPNTSEVAYWVNMFEQTHDETLFAQEILGSPEFLGHIGGSANFIPALYGYVLGTDQIPAGAQAYWQSVLNSDGNNYALVARAFLNTTNAETLVIQANYQQILGRAPTASELSGWLNQMQAGQESLFGIGISLLASNEIYNLATQVSQE